MDSVLANFGAYLVLRQRWPSIREGWRRHAFLGLSGLSVLSFALPLVLGLGHHGVLPVVGMPLKLFGSGWLVASLGMPLFRFAFDYMLGCSRRGDGQLYVSGGTGHWLPFRLGVPAEVSFLTLRADT